MSNGTTFIIYSDNPSLPFYVRNDTGDLIAFDEIDREKQNLYEFNVIVSSFYISAFSFILASVKPRRLNFKINL